MPRFFYCSLSLLGIGRAKYHNGMKRFLLVFAFLASVVITKAQDVIITKDSERIEAKITEITDNKVKYKKFDNLEEPEIILSAEKIASIVFANGEVFVFPSKTAQQHEQKYDIIIPNKNTLAGIEYVPGTQLKRKNSAFYYGDKKLTNKQYESFLLENCELAYNKFKQADLQLVIGGSSFLVSLACLGVGAIYFIKNKMPPDIFLYGAVGGVILAPICIVAYNTKLNKSIELFNQNCAIESKKSNSYISFGVNSSRVGLSIYF